MTSKTGIALLEAATKLASQVLVESQPSMNEVQPLVSISSSQTEYIDVESGDTLTE